MSQEIAIYLRQTSLNDTFWHDVTEYLSHTSVVEIRSTLDNERLDFSLALIEPLTAAGIPIIPSCGDDIVICENNTRTKVLADSVGGWIYYVKDNDPTFDDDTFVEYQIKAKHRDFSKEEIELDISTVITFFDLLIKLFKTANIKDFLGGIMPSGKVIDKYVSEYQNVDMPGFKSKGIISELFNQVIKNLGLHSKTVLLVEPDIINNLKLLYSIRIFDGTGDSQITDDWGQGINNQILSDGEIPNPAYIDDIVTPFEPKMIWCENSFGYEEDASPVKNDIRLDAYVIDEPGKVTFKKIRQRDDSNTVFNLDSPALDILYVARYISDTAGENTIIIESVASTTVFNIDLDSANKIIYDKTRLENNNLGTRLVCRIKVGTTYFIRKFTMAGQTITLDPVSPTELDVIGLTTSSEFELVNGYDQLKPNRISYPGDNNGYTIKNIKFGENASITFSDIDKPQENEYVIIGFYKLNAFRSPVIYENSRDLYDIGIVREQIPYPVTLQQYNLILDQYIKMLKALITISFKSYRLNLCQVGWSISITLTKRRQIIGNFLISEAVHRLISSESPYYEKGLWESEYIARSYRDSLPDLLAKFQNNYSVTETLLEENKVIKNTPIIIEIVHHHYENSLIPNYLAAPTATAPTAISNTSFTANCTPVEGATGYILEIYTDEGMTETLMGYTNLNVGNATSFVVNNSFVESESGPFYYRWKAYNDSTESKWSNLITVNKNSQTSSKDLVINSNTKVYIPFRNSNSNDISGNNNNGTVYGTAPYRSGIIEDDDTCLDLSITGNYVEIPYNASFNAPRQTIDIVFRFIEINTVNVLATNYDVSSVNNNRRWYIDYYQPSQCFRISIHGSTSDQNDFVQYSAPFIASAGEEYFASLSVDPSANLINFSVNGFPISLTYTGGNYNLVTQVDWVNTSSSAPIRICAFKNADGINGLSDYSDANIYVTRFAIHNEYRDLAAHTQSFTNLKSNLNFVTPSGKNAGILYNKISFFGAGTQVTDLANSNNATLSNNTSWRFSFKWGYGVNLQTVNTSIPHSNSYKTSGSNAKFMQAYVIQINEINNNTTEDFYITQNPPNTEINVYYSFDNTGKIILGITLHEEQLHQPSLLGFETTPFTVITGQDIGIAYFIDLSTNTIGFLINNTELTYSILTTNSEFYNTIDSFKAVGGLFNYNQTVHLNQSSNFLGLNAKATLFRMLIAKESDSLTITEAKSMFANMGLT